MRSASPAMRDEARDAVRAGRWVAVRRAALVAYFAIILCIVLVEGVPTGRQSIALLIVIGLCLTRIGLGWPALGRVVLDWLPFTAVLIAYDRTRGLADAVGLPLHVSDVVHAERWICGGSIPTVWLQHHLYDVGTVHWYDAAVTLVYTSHFLTTPILAAVLWLRDRTQWVRYIGRVIVLSAAGLVTYVVFPEAPPWLAAKDGAISVPVARLSARGWSWLHLGNVEATLDRAQQAGSNPVAAMPSLHFALAVLVALFVGSRLRSRTRWLLALYPLAMGFTLVYTGEHYVLDLLVGGAYALVVHRGFTRWEARRAADRDDALSSVV